MSYLLRLALSAVLILTILPALHAAPTEGQKGAKGPKGGSSAGAIDTVAAAKPADKSSTLKLTSPVVKDGGALPVEFTGDGASASPPLAWTGVPKGTQSLVLIMHHLDPEGKTKIYWLIHDIDPKKVGATKNATDLGQMGLSTVRNRVEYAAPHSKGPGEKKYVLTLFALSAKPDLTKAETPISVGPLLAAMKGKVLAAADLTVTYTRNAGSSDKQEEKRPPRREEGAK